METAAIASSEYFQEQVKASSLWFSEDLIEKKIDANILDIISQKTAETYQIIPVEIGDTVVLVTHNEQAFKDSEQIKRKIGKEISILFADEENVKSALSHYYKINGTNYFRRRAQVSDIDITPLKRKINSMIQDAIKKKASDIHLLPQENGMKVEFRVVGHIVNLTTDYNFQPDETTNIINIIKDLDTSGQTDTAKANMPNQGSFAVNHDEVTIDVRISTVPLAGSSQKVNLRLLPQKKTRVSITDLGYLPEDLQAIRSTLLKSGSGMFLNSGPTGSGKTTSLYAQIYHVLDITGEPAIVMAIENPVEIYEPDFVQVQVREAEDERVSLTAPKIFHTGLRQDPDIFLYGEIRHKGDAEVAIEAATSGHRLFSTVHAKDCVSTIARLLDLGVSRTSILRELKMIISQRLVAILCPHCSVPHELTLEEKLVLTLDEQVLLMASNLRARGSDEAVKKCPHCSFGYTKRTAVAEYIIFDMELRDALLENVKFSSIDAVLRQKGYVSMWEKGLRMVADGQTDLMEILHVIGKD